MREALLVEGIFIVTFAREMFCTIAFSTFDRTQACQIKRWTTVAIGIATVILRVEFTGYEPARRRSTRTAIWTLNTRDREASLSGNS